MFIPLEALPAARSWYGAQEEPAARLHEELVPDTPDGSSQAVVRSPENDAQTVSAADWCEFYDDELGDLSGECATEQEWDDANAYALTLEAEVQTLEGLLGSEVAVECDELVYPYPPEAQAVCPEIEMVPPPAVPPEPYPAEPHIAGPYAPDGGMMPAGYEVTAADVCLDTDVSAGCLDEAVAAVGGLVIAAFEVNRWADWTVSNLFRMTGRALAAKTGWMAAAVGLGGYGVYSYIACRLE